MQPLKPTLEQLLARAEISDVLLRYMRGVDRREMDLVRSAFHPGATQTNPYLSPGETGTVEGLIELMVANAQHIPMSMHLLGNIVFEFANDELAIVESYLMAYQVHRDDKGAQSFRETGSRYLDRFEKRDDEWRIASRGASSELHPAGRPYRRHAFIRQSAHFHEGPPRSALGASSPSRTGLTGNHRPLMRVMITGGTGFLGASLARYLVEEKGQSDVVLFDSDPHPDVVADVAASVSIVRGDVADGPDVIRVAAAHGIDTIAHLGSTAGLPAPGQTVAYVRRQFLGTTNVFESARVLGIRRVVNASSVSVWGDLRDSPVSEDDPTSPRNLYGSHKVWSEHLAEHYNQAFGMEILSLRMSAVYGYGRLKRLERLSASGLTSDLRGQRPHFLTAPELLGSGRPFVMPPDDQVVDLLYERDNAQAWWLALSTPNPVHRVFNVRGDQRPAGDITEQLRLLMPRAEIEQSDQPIDRDQLMDNRRIADELGFASRFPLEQAMEDYVGRISWERPRSRP